jgi:hypothetical protein
MIVLLKEEVTKNMTTDLKCPYGIPDSDCCQASTCPTYVARQKRNKK